MSDELVFYTHPMSRGRVVRWMLEEVGIPYRTEILEYGEALKAAEYLAINPMGKVPAIRHGDVVVTECAAICAYLADTYPEIGLAPPPGKRAAYYRWLFFAAGPMEAAFANQAMNVVPTPDQERMVGYGNMQRVLSTLEQSVKDVEFIAADHFTAADLYVGAHIGFGMQFGTLEKRPAFEDYYARVSDRDAFRRARELDDAAMPQRQP
jgi:glutathione S-transferase